MIESTTSSESLFPPLAERYERIAKANQESFYMTDPNRSFDVFMSVESAGGNRLLGAAAARHMLGDNMSIKRGPEDIDDQTRVRLANEHVRAYLNPEHGIGVDGSSVILLNPAHNYDRALNAINIDLEAFQPHDLPASAEEEADFIYTYNPNLALGAKPADCPIVIASAETPKGPIYMMTHFAWRGAAQPETTGVKAMTKIYDKFGVDRSTLQMYVAPGGQAESFQYTGYDHDPYDEYPDARGLFEVTKEENGSYSFTIDTPYYVYSQLLELGIDPKQIFVDVSDTASTKSGYSSHGRSVRLQKEGIPTQNSRDLVIAKFRPHH